MTDLTGKQLSHYRLERLLGTGGFAEVYLATHMHLNIQVAIKVLHTRLIEEKMELFRNEARAIANLKHPHIVRMLDFGIEDGQLPYLVMDYLPRGTLRQFYTQEAPLPLTTIALYIRQIAEALQYAHDARYIHRDVKPDNMLMTTDSHLLLSDFSLAVIAHNTSSQSTQHIAGTPTYMAPEQIEQYPRPASDQYALGVVVYEWLCGQPPFSGTMLEIATKHCIVAPPPLRKHNPAIPPAVEYVVLRALEKDWQARFPTIREFAQALQRASHTSTVTAIRQLQEAEPPLANFLPANVRPSHRQRSRLPIIKDKTPVKKQALWMSGYTALMLVWWLPYLVDLLSDGKPATVAAAGLSGYMTVVIDALIPTGALLAGALFGAWRGGLVTTAFIVGAIVLSGYDVIWGGNVSIDSVMSYLFFFAFCILAALVVGKIQQLRSRRSFLKAYLMMLLGATIVILGSIPGLFGGITEGGMTIAQLITYGLLFVGFFLTVPYFLALPAAIIETLIQHTIGQEENRYI